MRPLLLPHPGSLGCVPITNQGYLWKYGQIHWVSQGDLSTAHRSQYFGLPQRPNQCLPWGLPGSSVSSPDGNSLIRPSRVFLDGGGRRCVGLLGETRSPENQQSRGSCPGAPAPGNPEGRASWGLTEQSQRNVPWPPFLALGRHCPQLSPGGWATALDSFTQADCPSQGRHSRECLLSARVRHPGAQGGSTILAVGIRIQVTAQSLYPVNVSSTPLYICFVIHSMGRDRPCFSLAVSLAVWHVTDVQ